MTRARILSLLVLAILFVGTLFAPLAAQNQPLPLGTQMANVRIIAYENTFNWTCTGRVEWVGEYYSSYHEVANSGGAGSVFTISGVPADVSGIELPDGSLYGDVVCENNLKDETTVLTEWNFNFEDLQGVFFDGEVFFGSPAETDPG